MPQRISTPSYATAAALWLIVVLVFIVTIIRATVEGYSPDSWSYIDIARSVFEPGRQIGDINGVRDWSNEPWINDSFPLLWPALLAPGVAMWGPLAPVGPILNSIVWLSTVLAFGLLGSHKKWQPSIAPLAGLGLLALPGYVNEMHAGRSIPLSILLTIVALAIMSILPRHTNAYWPILLAGLLFGLSAANRFDALLHGPIVMGVALIMGLTTWRHGAVFLSAWSTGPALWILYSSIRLGGFYVTDNRSVALSPRPVEVVDYPIREELTSFEGILLWFGKLGSHVGTVEESLLAAFRLQMILFFLALALAYAISRKESHRDSPPLLAPQSTQKSGDKAIIPSLLAIFCLMVVLQAALVLVTGYGDVRYWAISSSVLLIATVFLVQDFPRRLLTSLLGFGYFTLLAGIGITSTAEYYSRPVKASFDDTSFVSCIKQTKDDAVMMSRGGAYRIAAIYDVRVVRTPSNFDLLSRDDWKELSTKFDVTHWVTNESDFQLPPAAEGVLTLVVCT